MTDTQPRWLVKVIRFQYATVLRICDTQEEAEATAQSLNQAYQTSEYFVEVLDRSRWG